MKHLFLGFWVYQIIGLGWALYNFEFFLEQYEAMKVLTEALILK